VSSIFFLILFTRADPTGEPRDSTTYSCILSPAKFASPSITFFKKAGRSLKKKVLSRKYWMDCLSLREFVPYPKNEEDPPSCLERVGQIPVEMTPMSLRMDPPPRSICFPNAFLGISMSQRRLTCRPSFPPGKSAFPWNNPSADPFFFPPPIEKSPRASLDQYIFLSAV